VKWPSQVRAHSGLFSVCETVLAIASWVSVPCRPSTSRGRCCSSATTALLCSSVHAPGVSCSVALRPGPASGNLASMEANVMIHGFAPTSESFMQSDGCVMSFKV
jgi:hypothetical protein